MTQNMFQEGLHHVYFNDTPPASPQAAATNQGEPNDVRIHRWFSTVVNTRVLLAGVVQVLSALACILFTAIHACVRYNCAISKMVPVWSSLFYIASGCLAINVRKNPNKMKVITLMVLNLFSLLLGFCAMLAYSFNYVQAVTLNTNQQQAGDHVAKGSSIAFTVLCLLASIYTLFLSWRGLRRYSGPHILTYSRLSQAPDENVEPLLEHEDFSL